MIRCLFRYSTDAGTSSCLWRFNLLLLRLLGEISLSLPHSYSSWGSSFVQLPGFSVGVGPVSACRSPESVCSSLTQDGVKAAADSGALDHSGRREGGARTRGRASGGRGRHDAAAAQGAPCAPPRKSSLDHGSLAVADRTGSREGWCG